MTEIKYAKGQFSIDDEGFLANSDEWNEDIAKELALKEEIPELSEEKLAIVRFMRDYYLKFHAFPILNYVCKNIHQPKQCVSEEFINPMKAWKIAGLPKPEGIHFVPVESKKTTYLLEECC